MQQYATIKRALRVPAQASAEAKALFKSVLKLPTFRSEELVQLRENYEGDHDVLISRYLRKPPAWDDTTWAYVREGLMAINSTRTSLRSLSSGVYGGVQFRKISSELGPFAAQINAFIASPSWRASMKRVMREAALYGTSYFAPYYNREKRRLGLRHLNPVTTHIITSDLEPEIPIAVAEFDERRNYVRIWTSSFYAILARKEEDVEFIDFVDENEEQIDRPFFPVLVARAEEVPGSPYGLSMLRDTPKFNRSLSVSYFNVSYSSLLKAQALLTIKSGDSSDEVNADLTQLGPHTALILPQGGDAEFKSNGADINALLEVIDRLQDLESYILGIPNIRAQKNLSAEGARLAAAPLTSQVSELALTMSSVETAGIHLLAMIGHWEVGSPLTPEDSERLYKVSVRINPSINVESLQERTQSKTMLANQGVIAEEEIVAEFSPHLSYPEVEAQAEIMRERNQVSKSSVA